VKLVDANVLLYGANESAQHHVAARDWLTGALSGDEPVGFAWVVVLAFVRLATRVGVFPRPLELMEATAVIEAWLAQPPAIVAEPRHGHLQVVTRLLESVGSTGGNLVNDAHLAALAVQYRATVVSFDRDFERFGVPWSVPSGR
jgi:toxin-antitoxin system PIN domain toxin